MGGDSLGGINCPGFRNHFLFTIQYREELIHMLQNLGPLFILLALCSLASGVILAFSFVFMHFYNYDEYKNNKKAFTKKRSVLIVSLLFGYIIFYVIGMYLIN